MRRLISSGSPFESQAGYSRAVVDGDWCFVSGTTGYDYATMQMPESVEDQTRNCLATIEAALREAGAPGMHLGVSPVNRNAQKFYARMGFVRVEDRALPRDTVFMARHLGAS
jgi:enamine deaminase RidA (YjgF/YER057c/UK114 family)